MLLKHSLNRRRHVEVLFIHVVVLAFQNVFESAYGIFHFVVLAGHAGELFGNIEILRKKFCQRLLARVNWLYIRIQVIGNAWILCVIWSFLMTNGGNREHLGKFGINISYV